MPLAFATISQISEPKIRNAFEYENNPRLARQPCQHGRPGRGPTEVPVRAGWTDLTEPVAGS